MWHEVWEYLPIFKHGNKTQNLDAMKTLKCIILLSFLFVLVEGLSAQDIIIKKDADTVYCKIKEIGSEEIKYILPDYPSDLLFTIPKEKIDKLIFENGREMTFQVEMDNPINYSDQNKNALKIDFLSPLTGNTTFAWEHSLKPGQSIESTLGIIGLGFDPNDNNPQGSFVKFGMKFIKSPDFYIKGMRYAHILKGSYVKPEVSFGYYTKLNNMYNNRYPPGYDKYEERKSYFSSTVQVVIGKQWVINDIFLVDFYGGVGYGFDDGDGHYHYGYSISAEVPLSFSAGMKIGVLF